MHVSHTSFLTEMRYYFNIVLPTQEEKHYVGAIPTEDCVKIQINFQPLATPAPVRIVLQMALLLQ